MIFTYGFFEKNKLPKFYGNVAKMMKSVNNSLFVGYDDASILHAKLKKQLEKDRPAKSTSYVDLYYCANGNDGGIYVYPDKNAENAIIRILFTTVSNIFEHDESTGHYSCLSAHFIRKEAQDE